MTESAVQQTTQLTSQKLPPMLTQYLEYKAKHPDALLLFQVGDFYETFFEDAVTISRVLNLTLTSRDKNSPKPIPMAGVPIGVIDSYLDRLVAQGYSVALVSQSEAPQNGKGMFSRKLERIVTPGVRILGGAEAAAGAGTVAAVYLSSADEGAIAFTDVQSGIVQVREHISSRNLSMELPAIAPDEVVLTRTSPFAPRAGQLPWLRSLSVKLRPDPASDSAASDRRTLAAIKGYSTLSPWARRAVRMLVSYIDETTVDAAISLSEIRIRTDAAVMTIDATTRANLELVRSLRDGTDEGTLASVLDLTCSSGGGRLIRSWIVAPLVEPEAIRARLSSVRFLREQVLMRAELRQRLEAVCDVERIGARIDLLSAAPRELGALRDTIRALPEIRRAIEGAGVPELLQEAVAQLEVSPQVLELLEGLAEVPPLSTHEGGIFRDGFDQEIDRLRALKSHGHSWIAELESKERESSGISSLKIRYNNIIGFFFEITKANLARVPAHFVRRQATANSERFSTPELAEREQQVLGAEGALFARERSLFERIRESLRQSTEEIRRVARALSAIDVLASFAELADREAYSEPEIVESPELVIEDGKHPVLAKLLRSDFVPNSLAMQPGSMSCAVITGPNMGGKSTYLRQAALVTIMAQIGSFVPARCARVGIVDRIFARLGASDNLAEGESTFMVEMREAAHIVAHATPRSLLLIDEIGRGTATADGLAIARAILEWIVTERGCRTLFATHFHELTALAGALPGVVNLSVGSVEQGEDVLFTHQICEGAANQSYGIAVAKLAGLPPELIDAARAHLSELAAQRSCRDAARSGQLSFFDAPASTPIVRERRVVPADYAGLTKLRDTLCTIDIDGVSPREALDILAGLVSTLGKGKEGTRD